MTWNLILKIKFITNESKYIYILRNKCYLWNVYYIWNKFGIFPLIIICYLDRHGWWWMVKIKIKEQEIPNWFTFYNKIHFIFIYTTNYDEDDYFLQSITTNPKKNFHTIVNNQSRPKWKLQYYIFVYNNDQDDLNLPSSLSP